MKSDDIAVLLPAFSEMHIFYERIEVVHRRMVKGILLILALVDLGKKLRRGAFVLLAQAESSLPT